MKREWDPLEPEFSVGGYEPPEMDVLPEFSVGGYESLEMDALPELPMPLATELSLHSFTFLLIVTP